MIFWKGDIVEIRGISQLGKNRIREHGVIWKVSNIVVKDMLGIMPAGSILLESMDNKDYLRWCQPNDRHFHIVRIVDLNNI